MTAGLGEFIVLNYQCMDMVATSYTIYNILWKLTTLLEIIKDR
jgi:hypothetical protein